jgi:hypothetical protein
MNKKLNKTEWEILKKDAYVYIKPTRIIQDDHPISHIWEDAFAT